jgi:hypothetical protein
MENSIFFFFFFNPSLTPKPKGRLLPNPKPKK